MKAKSFFIILLSILLLSCNNKKETTTTQIEKEPETKILIAYYSLSGNTKAVAEQIYDKFGGDMFEIELTNPYPNNEQEVIDIVKVERDENFLPEVSNKIENFDDYDIVFLGTPIWFGTAATPVLSFIKSYDFSGKIIYPFYTCGRGTVGTYIDDIKILCPDANVQESFGNRRPDREEGTHIEKVNKHLDEIEIK